jgi:maltose-binding protein MalE
MKIALIMLIIMVGSMTASYFAGKHTSNNIVETREILQSEHSMILDSMNNTKGELNGIKSQLNQIEKKLDILVNIAIASSPLNDGKPL